MQNIGTIPLIMRIRSARSPAIRLLWNVWPNLGFNADLDRQ